MSRLHKYRNSFCAKRVVSKWDALWQSLIRISFKKFWRRCPLISKYMWQVWRNSSLLLSQEITYLFGSFKFLKSFVVQVALKAPTKPLNYLSRKDNTLLYCLQKMLFWINDFHMVTNIKDNETDFKRIQLT